MKIDSQQDGARATISPAGLIDTRGSQEFERHLVGLFNNGMRQAIVDLSQVDLITSAGIRVLVMMAKRLQLNGGGLVLCALSATVRGVFDIAGLLGQFRIAGSRDEAATLLASVEGAPSARTRPGSKLSRVLVQLLAEDDAPGPPAERSGGARSPLAEELLALIERTAGAGAAEPPRG